jgi:hypothetical protein
MPTLSRKLRIALDWTVDLLFSRDFVELGLHRGRRYDASRVESPLLIVAVAGLGYVSSWI